MYNINDHIRGFYFSSINKVNKLFNLDITSLNSTNDEVVTQTHKLIRNIIFFNFLR